MNTFLIMLCLLLTSSALADEYLGKLSENPYGADSTSNEYGQYGSEYSADSINNPYGEGLSIYGDDDSVPCESQWCN